MDIINTLHTVREKPPDKRSYLSCNVKLTERARAGRKNPPSPEKRFWYEMLQGKRFLGLKFTRQRKIGDYVIDFYCSKLKLAVEIDGDTHDEQQEYDDRRTAYLAGLGIEVVRYNNGDVMNNLEGVYLDLKQHCQERKG